MRKWKMKKYMFTGLIGLLGSYPPDISLNETKKLIDLGRQKGVTLVLDNLQTPIN